MNIQDYQNIIIYRHINPDYDAFGSQLGTYFVLKEIYKGNIVLGGNMNHPLLNIYPTFTSDNLQVGKTLGIVVDTANKERIDGDISVCDDLLKIDHHIIVDNFGKENIVDEHASSCSEIITLLIKEHQLPINQDIAKCLYIGIVGDSGRFLFNSTTSKTFEAASFLLNTGIDLSKLYQDMYLESKVSLDVQKYILNNYKTDGGVAYYYLSDETLKMLGIDRSEGSNYVQLLSNIKEYPIYFALTQNIKDNNYRVSIRSRDIPINQVANQFRGGGHALAAGATLNSLDELEKLIQALKECIINE